MHAEVIRSNRVTGYSTAELPISDSVSARWIWGLRSLSPNLQGNLRGETWKERALVIVLVPGEERLSETLDW